MGASQKSVVGKPGDAVIPNQAMHTPRCILHKKAMHTHLKQHFPEIVGHDVVVGGRVAVCCSCCNCCCFCWSSWWCIVAGCGGGVAGGGCCC